MNRSVTIVAAMRGVERLGSSLQRAQLRADLQRLQGRGLGEGQGGPGGVTGRDLLWVRQELLHLTAHSLELTLGSDSQFLTLKTCFSC